MKHNFFTTLIWICILSQLSQAKTYSLELTPHRQQYSPQNSILSEKINWHIRSLNLETIWQKTRGAGVTIAILDTGLNDPNHILSSKIIDQKNFFNSKNNDTRDVYGHGTSVTGIITGFDRQNLNFTSVAPESNILIAKVSDDQGTTQSKALSDAIIWAADRGARIVSVSYSIVGLDPEIEKAAQYLYSKGGLVVHSTGNSGIEINRKNSAFLLAVGASNLDFKRAKFSNYGEILDIVAPGVDLYTLSHTNQYTFESGTSFATPLVSAILALAISCNPHISVTDLVAATFQTQSEANQCIWNKEIGWGIINPKILFENKLFSDCKLKSDMSSLY